jgi:hypothetical protein
MKAVIAVTGISSRIPVALEEAQTKAISILFTSTYSHHHSL